MSTHRIVCGLLLFGRLLWSDDWGLRISPPNLVHPGEAQVIVFADKCDAQKTLAKAKLETVTQGISIRAASIKAENCSIRAMVDVGDIVQPGPLEFLVTGENGQLLGTVRMEYRGALARGPVFPGMDPQVDIMWNPMSYEVCSDDFGKRVSDRFYCVEVVIGNNTGYGLQISAVGFLPLGVVRMAGSQSELPNSGYLVSRSVLQREQVTSARNYTYRGLQSAGLIMAGFIPFFGNARPKAHYTAMVSLMANSLVQGFDLFVPDRTVRQLNNLDDQVLRDGRLIPNNLQWRTVVFFERAAIQNTLQAVIEDLNAPPQRRGDCGNDKRPCELQAKVVMVSDSRTAKGMKERTVRALITGRNIEKAAFRLPDYFKPLTAVRSGEGWELTFEVPKEWMSVRVPVTVVSEGRSNVVAVQLEGELVAPKVAKQDAVFLNPKVFNKTNRLSRNIDPQIVRKALNRLVIVGDIVEYKQRVRIDSTTKETGEVPVPPRVDSVQLDTEGPLADGDKNRTLIFHGTNLENTRIRASGGIGELNILSNDFGSTVRAAITIPDGFDQNFIDFLFVNPAGNVTLHYTNVRPHAPKLTKADPSPVPTKEEKEIKVTITGEFLKGTTVSFGPAEHKDWVKEAVQAEIKSASELVLTVKPKKDAAGKLEVTVQRGSAAALKASLVVELKP